MSSLSGKVAVVTGASRGIGKGIALALAEQGATVYVTGRTVTPGSYPLPGTVGETAIEVDRRGGKGIAVQVDHAKDDQVAALFEQVRREQGQSSTHHNLLNHTCDIDGDVAHTETYYRFVGRNRDDSNWIAGGRYIDRLERRDGAWKIALRANAIEWSGIVPTLPIPFSDVPDINLNGAAARSKDDPSYLRPLINQRKLHTPAS